MPEPIKSVKDLRLELLRPGRAHNQLLSPLTPYIALCGEDGPVTINIPYEHRQLLTRLNRLRYALEGVAIAREQRESELRELGETLGNVFGSVPSLFTEIGNALDQCNSLVHLRLCLSGAELGLLPFETAIAPDGLPGSGSPLLLSPGTPIILTRELRRMRPLEVRWNRTPNILFAFASPEGFAPVPAQEHLDALRSAIEPWVAIENDADKRLPHVKELLTVLPNATLNDIGRACAEQEYTHVHILAHGDAMEKAGDRRFGLILASHQGKAYEIVDGEQLAIAIMGRDSTGRALRCPSFVSLFNCDSGNISSVLTPGGSIAHDLHLHGIPWVIASQFPLWMRASTIATSCLYDALIRGDDPRWALCELRQRLRTDCPETHDWASFVVYATVPENFDSQIATFRSKLIKDRIEVLFKHIDNLLGNNSKRSDNTTLPLLSTDDEKGIYEHHDAIRKQLKIWRSEPLRHLHITEANRERSERLGISGASEKRIAIALTRARNDAETDHVKKAYKQAAEFYQQAVESSPNNYWAMTQFLSIRAVQVPKSGDAETELVTKYRIWWMAAHTAAQMQRETTTGRDQAWAYSTLAELELLGTVYDARGYRHTARVRTSIESLCKELLKCVEPGDFAICSTLRQFKRYVDYWSDDRPIWKDLAQAAIEILEPAAK